MTNNRGYNGLTRRQSQCLALVNQGMTSKEIARQLDLSPSTVDNHLREAIVRMGKNNRQEAARDFALAHLQVDQSERLPGDCLPRAMSLVRLDDIGPFTVFICKN
ncbi:helix-turn-helix transcriptional regulator [Novosphingobium resinovorum]|jgi:hypothetical protein|uniref:Regulatory protein LuxR n=1 Tax=Novosphingobium resinovorum TaxID=158500 RepID=A0A031K602_9SPHN|nr:MULTISPECIES: helix-turn-helix transcriptional regulator [Sphingomonadaceae]AOR75711.1 hypothetical protein BES08_02300 [Novosphingobium resinovorum]EJU12990.1 regulatory protein LuxR [Sphingomonas sp. LH128]EZP84690.1 Regulatory protein LuxR [Novosphingobium resinovorum]MBF7011059.1 helix-turn-helix transcriptional regulator [Novosphingobium sp. HR1a]WJM29049.1 helix-turn-helix transcriptional regulator [Novosphingobium resinovorum]